MVEVEKLFTAGGMVGLGFLLALALVWFLATVMHHRRPVATPGVADRRAIAATYVASVDAKVAQRRIEAAAGELMGAVPVTLPNHCRGRLIDVGEATWTVPWALCVDAFWKVYIRPECLVAGQARGGTLTIHVTRTSAGYEVRMTERGYLFTPAKDGCAGLPPVVRAHFQ